MSNRHAIGGNSPPPHEAFSLSIDDLIGLISATLAGGSVETDLQEAALDGLLDDVRQVRKDADAQRAAEKKPHDDAAKAVQAIWKPLIDKCDKGADAIKAAVTPYRAAKQRAIEAAARKAREEAEEARKRAQEALQASDELESRLAAEQALKQADKQASAAKRVEKAPTGLRTRWVARIDDQRAALIDVLNRNPQPILDALVSVINAQARGAREPIAGVTYIETKEAF
jgi:hypothetical protein